MEVSQKIFFIRQAIRSKGSVSISVEGTSMVPTIYENMEVLVKDSKEIREGDIAVFFSGSESVVHRVYKKKLINDIPHLITKGDSLFILDPPVVMEKVLGKVTAVRCKGEFKSINGRLSIYFWKVLMPVQLFIGKNKHWMPVEIQKTLKSIYLRLFAGQ